MNREAQPTVVGPGDGRIIEGPVGGPLTFKIRGEETNGALTVFENVIPPGQGPPLHVHANEDESWYVLAGGSRVPAGRGAPSGTRWVVRVCAAGHAALLRERRW